MSSGSCFTIYRKHTNSKASQEVLSSLKNEYFLAGKKDLLGDSQDDAKLRENIPLLMQADFKAGCCIESNCSSIFYDADGYAYDKLLDFYFGSTFSCLKDKFRLNAYKYNESSVLVSKAEAEKMLQAIMYILGEEYSKKFEQIMSNEYVELFGSGYSPFDSRFKQSSKPIYIDKDGDSFTVHFNDYSIDAEIAESDNDVKFNLNRARACLLAFLNAEECSWENEELVLEYSAT